MKFRLLALLVLLSIGASAQRTWTSYGANGIQRSTVPDTLFRSSGGASGYVYWRSDWYNKQNFGDIPSGSTNRLAKFTGTNTIGNSRIYDNGTLLGFGAAPGNYDPSGDPEHLFQFINDNTPKQVIAVTSAGASAYQNNVHWYRYAGTVASPTATQSGMLMMSMGFRGHDGNGITQSAGAFQAYVPNTWTPSSTPIGFRFQTTNTGSDYTGRSTALEIRENQDVYIGNNLLVFNPVKNDWNQNYKVLNMTRTSGIRTHTASSDVLIFNNLYYDAVGYKYGYNGVGTGLLFDATGNMQYLTAPSGSANAVAPISIPFQVDINGNSEITGKFTIGSGVYTANKTSIYNDAVYGAVITSKGGSSYDIDIVNKNGDAAMFVPTGTKDVAFNGKATVVTAATNPTDVPQYQQLTTGLGLKENTANKQNSLSFDGTGVKFPTVDAVNATITPVSYTETQKQTQSNWYGDSYVDISNNWVSPALQFKTATGLKVNNYGVSGQTTTQIKARFDALGSYADMGFVIEGGRNDIDINGAISATATTIKANIAAMVATLTGAGNTKYLILGVIPKNSETCATTGGIFVTQLNADLLALYPNNFVPMSAAVQAANDGSANDLADIANCIMPRSKMFDAIHLNTSGYAVYTQQIINKLAVLMPDAGKYVTLANVGGIIQAGQKTLQTGTGGSVVIGDYKALTLPDQNTTQFLNTIIVGNGAKSLSHSSTTQGQANTIIGMNSAFTLTTGSGNTAIGANSLYTNSTGTDNTAVGESSGLLTTGSANVFFGKNAGRNVSTGSNNAFLTTTSGQGVSTGGDNVGIGFNTMFAGNSSGSVAIGVSALQNATGSPANNVAIGKEALKSGSGGVSQSIGIGRQTGVINTGSNNIFIGDLAGDVNTSGAKNLIIAHQGDLPSATASNQINIGNVIWGVNASATGASTAGQIGINVLAPTSQLHLGAGTATANTSPLKFTSGVDLTTAVAGAMEYDGSRLSFTPSTTRKRVVLSNDAQPTNGQIPIGSGVDYIAANITAGNGVSITNGVGSITVATTTFQLKLTGSGTGAATTISIPHGLPGITSANSVVASANNAATAGILYVTLDATNVNFVYSVAPITGTNNLSYSVSIK